MNTERDEYEEGIAQLHNEIDRLRALNSQPPREPLSDEKLWELWQVRGQGPIDFARAVLAAAQEKK